MRADAAWKLRTNQIKTDFDMLQIKKINCLEANVIQKFFVKT